MNRLVTGAALAAMLGIAATARAEPATPQEASALLARERPSYFLVGLGVESFGSTAKSFTRSKDLLLGPTLAWRASNFEPHFDVMLTPFSGNVRNLRLIGSLGTRAYWDVPHVTEFSIGWTMHLEARLQDHYWLASFTPIELGATVYRHGSLRVRTFVGARAAFAGALIDSFLLDPNGFRDEDAAQALDDTRHHAPWKLFVRLVFERRVN